MIASSRMALLGTFLFFATGEFLSSVVSATAVYWSFLSPLQWISSLVVVMTGQASIAEAVMGAATYAGHGSVSTLTTATMSGILGLLLVVSVEFIVTHMHRSSSLGGKLFLGAFAPIWTFLVEYLPMSNASPAFRAAVAPLEAQAYEIRLGTGFCIMLMAVITPMLAFLCTKAFQLILQPEKSYSASQ